MKTLLMLAGTALVTQLLTGCGGPDPAATPDPLPTQAVPNPSAWTRDPAPLHPLPLAPGEVRPPPVPIVPMPPDDD